MADPKANNVWVEQLGSSLHRGGEALDNVPQLLKELLESGAWQCFQPRMGPEVHHDRFVDFLTAAPLDGLGTSVDLVRRIVSGDTEALDLLDQALQNQHGGDHSKSNNVTFAPAGNAQEKALRKLRKDAPELHAEVLADRLSAHAAMVQAGFRPKTFTISTSSKPERIVEKLRRELDAETLAAIKDLL